MFLSICELLACNKSRPSSQDNICALSLKTNHLQNVLFPLPPELSQTQKMVLLSAF